MWTPRAIGLGVNLPPKHILEDVVVVPPYVMITDDVLVVDVLEHGNLDHMEGPENP